MKRLAAKLVALAVVSSAAWGYAQTPSPNQSAPAAAKMDPQQAQILADAQRLRKLSEELKAEIAKSNKETLSLSVIKKAQEVEKLAKSVKEEMTKGQ
jgi:hypothetical protein